MDVEALVIDHHDFVRFSIYQILRSEGVGLNLFPLTLVNTFGPIVAVTLSPFSAPASLFHCLYYFWGDYPIEPSSI